MVHRPDASLIKTFLVQTAMPDFLVTFVYLSEKNCFIFAFTGSSIPTNVLIMGTSVSCS